MEPNIFSSFAFQGTAHTHPPSATAANAIEVEVEVEIEDFSYCGETVTQNCTAFPPNWRQVLQAIRSMRAGQDAPVDQMGTHQLADASADRKTQKFQLLVAAVISSQTRDSVTAAAMKRLHALPGGLTVGNLSKEELTSDQLAEILKPVGFYRQKAKHLKAISKTLLAQPFNGHVPSTLNELLKLPGVGPKIALLVLWVAFGKGEEGFIVDTNVRRVCCRLGWAPDNANPKQVKESLETWLPRTLWPEISFLLVGFGQQMCKPIAPLCGRCQAKKMCPSALQDSKKEACSKKRLKY